MRITEVDQPITQIQLDALERALDQIFGRLGIDVEFTRHFIDRVNDERNIKQITLSELAQIFKKEFIKHGKPIAQLGPDVEAVMKDLQTDINIPFALEWDKEKNELDLVAKTVMRKSNFKTSNKEFTVEDLGNLPPLSDLIVMAVVAQTTVATLKIALTTAFKTGKGLIKLNKLAKRAGVALDSKLNSAMQEKIASDEERFMAAAVDALDKLVKSKGSKQSIGGYAFDIARAFRGINAKQLEKLYMQKTESVQAPFTKMLAEGGAMPGVGAIHSSEIEPTLAKLEKSLGIDLRNNALGSVGKREFSGDIDVALQIDADKIPEFVEKLKSNPLVKDIAKSSVIMTKIQIVNYDDSKSDGRPRTGFVQVDFMPGEPDWLKTYYHSPHENDSKYKGVFRNLMIASIAGVYQRKDSEEKLEDGRPMQSERWMFSPRDGLVRVMRTPVANKAGTGYTKKNTNKIIGGPYKNAQEIAQALGLDNADSLDSFETLLTAVKSNYAPEDQSKILKAFIDNPTVQDIGVPEELK